MDNGEITTNSVSRHICNKLLNEWDTSMVTMRGAQHISSLFCLVTALVLNHQDGEHMVHHALALCLSSHQLSLKRRMEKVRWIALDSQGRAASGPHNVITRIKWTDRGDMSNVMPRNPPVSLVTALRLLETYRAAERGNSLQPHSAL